MEVLLKQLKLAQLYIAYYGIPHQHLTNSLRQFFKRLRVFSGKIALSPRKTENKDHC